MSIKEAIDRAATLGGWKLTAYDTIRRGCDDHQCPVSSLDRESAGEFIRVGKLHGLSFVHLTRIADAADNATYEKARLIRRYMLRKFGLQEAR